MNRPSPSLIPGYNVDRIDVAAGLRELTACGYHEPETVMVIEYALRRWARGEEEAAQRGAIDPSFHGIKLICWYRVVAAARAACEAPPTLSPRVQGLDPARIDDDEYFRAYCLACDPEAGPVTDEELPEVRAAYKLDLGLPPRDAAEAALIAGYRRVTAIVTKLK